MKSCFLFGHADCPETIMSKVSATIEQLYQNYSVRAFYVGSRGKFDSIAAAAVKRAKLHHPDLQLFLLLAYHPAERPITPSEGFDGTYYPPLEGIPRKYAIVHANRYMVSTADSIICYVRHPGNTRSLLEYAHRRQKKENIPIENVAKDS